MMTGCVMDGRERIREEKTINMKKKKMRF